MNIRRLKKFVDGSQQFPSREVEQWKPSGEVVRDANGQLEFEVEQILAQRGKTKKRQYLVKWKGYPLWEATWEKEDNLENSQDELREFRERVEARVPVSEEQVAGIFKGVASVTVQKDVQQGAEELKQWIAAKGISVLSALQSLLVEL